MDSEAFIGAFLGSIAFWAFILLSAFICLWFCKMLNWFDQKTDKFLTLMTAVFEKNKD